MATRHPAFLGCRHWLVAAQGYGRLGASQGYPAGWPAWHRKDSVGTRGWGASNSSRSPARSSLRCLWASALRSSSHRFSFHHELRISAAQLDFEKAPVLSQDIDTGIFTDVVGVLILPSGLQLLERGIYSCEPSLIGFGISNLYRRWLDRNVLLSKTEECCRQTIGLGSDRSPR